MRRTRQDSIFAQWMAEHLGVLQRMARGFAPPADQHDLVQELMLAVWKAVPAFRGDSSPRTFIYRVAHNRALTWRRAESRLGRRHAAAAADPALADPEPASSEADAAALEALYAAIRDLPPLDRSLVLLSLEGAAYAEIGRLHGLSDTAVGARLTRARQRLAAMLETPHGR